MRIAALLLALMAALPARAEPPVVVSAGPAQVSVTFYRDPDRNLGEINKEAPTGLALITETRELDLPAGDVVVRFEGVASAIVPQTAIVFGAKPRERNRDAALLSQGGLVDGFTGQAVILRRTDRATGKVAEERATIRSTADRLVIETPRGVEAVYCSGLAQTLLYPGVPRALSAKPVLSMLLKGHAGGRTRVTLAYVASGFDWDATYVGNLGTDGKSMQLMAWLTMASGDDTSFIDATAFAVGGKINRDEDTRDDSAGEAKAAAASLDKGSQCWPQGTTLDPYSQPQVPMPVAPMAVGFLNDEIVVTAQKRMESLMDAPVAVSAVTATSENLGDLKLYRIPVPVTVAAHSQKQVAFLSGNKVEGRLLYRSRVYWREPDGPNMLFRFKNSEKDGLGKPIPAGRAILYQEASTGRAWVGETAIPGKALDEEVELVFGEATNVSIETTSKDLGGERQSHSVVIRNANPFSVRFEMEFATGSDRVFSKLPGRLVNKPGKRVWVTELAANSETKIAYESRGIEEQE